MECLNCQRENDPDYRFCIFCGSLLPAGEVGQLPEGEPIQTADANLASTYHGQQSVESQSFRIDRRSGANSGKGWQMIRSIYEAITKQIKRRSRK